MKNVIALTALLLAATTYAAEPNAAAPQNSMGQGDMMKNCQAHMKDGKMMDSMPKDMMENCQKMMQNGGMMNGMMQSGGMKQDPAAAAGKADNGAESGTDNKKEAEVDHSQHHRAQ